MRALLFALALAGCASTNASTTTQAVTAEPVVAAERAFAARAGEIGWVPAFREYTAPDGVVLRPGPVNAPESLAQAEDDGDRSLQWWPAWAGIARSGDFGFTTGPFVFGDSDQVRGHYFTVWRRQPDGSWKWIFDGGVGVTDVAPIARDADVPALPVADRGAGSADVAEREVRALERHIHLARPDPREQLMRRFADEARINRRGMASAVGRDAAAAAVRATAIGSAEPLIVEASSAGDMVFTLGTAEWREGEVVRTGHYARVWQLRADGWQIVFDELIPAPVQAS
jgi:ketosteroid isomerase-like protein